MIVNAFDFPEAASQIRGIKYGSALGSAEDILKSRRLQFFVQRNYNTAADYDCQVGDDPFLAPLPYNANAFV